jgi:hypothetical protein
MNMTLSSGETRYTIEHRGRCVLVFGQVPMRVFGALAQLTHEPKKAVIDPTLARLAGANFAFGEPDDCKALRDALTPAAIARYQPIAAQLGLPAGSADWLGAGELGQSSMAMFQHLTGYQFPHGELTEPTAHPRDADDMRRCVLLVKAVPALRDQLYRLGELSPTWRAIEQQWRELEEAIGAGKSDHAYTILRTCQAS